MSDTESDHEGSFYILVHHDGSYIDVAKLLAIFRSTGLEDFRAIEYKKMTTEKGVHIGRLNIDDKGKYFLIKRYSGCAIKSVHFKRFNINTDDKPLYVYEFMISHKMMKRERFRNSPENLIDYWMDHATPYTDDYYTNTSNNYRDYRYYSY